MSASKYTNIDCYGMLGVLPNCTDNELTKAFHKLALEKHPDKNLEDSGATEAFQELNNVHDLLKDPASRADYDRCNVAFLDRIFGRIPKPVAKDEYETETTKPKHTPPKSKSEKRKEKKTRGKAGNGSWGKQRESRSNEDEDLNENEDMEDGDTDNDDGEDGDENDVDDPYPYYQAVYEQGPRASHYRGAEYQIKMQKIRIDQAKLFERQWKEQQYKAQYQEPTTDSTVQSPLPSRGTPTFSCYEPRESNLKRSKQQMRPATDPDVQPPLLSQGMAATCGYGDRKSDVKGSKRRTGSTMAAGSFKAQRRAQES